MAFQRVRVRFAPSPTGYLHLGGARTALFNWLLARHHGGWFVLRIEDTDQTRQVADSLEKILADLRWLRLEWDEGPEVGGQYGPYFQSERLDLYNRYCRQLLDDGNAYYAFDTPEELTAMREQARREKETFRYPRPATFPTEQQAQHARDEGKPVVVRFKMPDHDITVVDSVLGKVTLKTEELEDFVIRKADGFATYHFACVVDDELMKISHVLRGSEHLNNTPKHIALQQALGFATPAYAHLPIIFNMSGSKMSKRDKEKAIARGETPPEIDVHDFRMSGYLPEVLLNFIALLGWSPGDDREQLTVDELVELFSIERIGKTSAKFDRQKLLAFNTDWSARLPEDRLLEAFKDYLHVRTSSEPRPSGSGPSVSTTRRLQPADDNDPGNSRSRGLQPARSPEVEDRPDTRVVAQAEACGSLGDKALAPGWFEASEQTLRKVLEVCQGFRTFADVIHKCGFLFADDDAIDYDPQAVKKVLAKDGGQGYAMLERLLPELQGLADWSPAELEKLLKDKVEAWGVGFGKIAQPIRVAVSGTTVSPQIIDTLLLLGRDRTIARINRCLSMRQ